MNDEDDEDVRDPHATTVEECRVGIRVAVGYADVHFCSVLQTHLSLISNSGPDLGPQFHKYDPP